MKIRTTVYSHKVIDVVDFVPPAFWSDDDIVNLFVALADKTIEGLGGGIGRIHIKVDRPLSQAEKDHRLGVVAKNLEEKNKYSRWYSQRQLDNERKEYERLKAKFEGS